MRSGSRCALNAIREFFQRYLCRDGWRQDGEEDCGHAGAGYESQVVTGREEDCVSDVGRLEVFLLHKWEDRGGGGGGWDAGSGDERVRRRSEPDRLGARRNLF